MQTQLPYSMEDTEANMHIQTRLIIVCHSVNVRLFIADFAV